MAEETPTQSTKHPYPKRITRTFTCEVEVLNKEEEEYFTSTDVADNILADLSVGFFPDIRLGLVSINGIKLAR